MPPGCGGAVRPEKRVTAWSKLPQKKWTGLHLAEEARAELLEHAVDLEQHAPEALGCVGIVGGVRAVLRERDRLRHLVGAAVDTRPLMPSSASAAMSRSWNSATDCGSSGQPAPGAVAGLDHAARDR